MISPLSTDGLKTIRLTQHPIVLMEKQRALSISFTISCPLAQSYKMH